MQDKIFQMLPDKKLSQIMKAEDVGGDIKEEDVSISLVRLHVYFVSS